MRAAVCHFAMLVGERKGTPYMCICSPYSSFFKHVTVERHAKLSMDP